MSKLMNIAFVTVLGISISFNTFAKKQKSLCSSLKGQEFVSFNHFTKNKKKMLLKIDSDLNFTWTHFSTDLPSKTVGKLTCKEDIGNQITLSYKNGATYLSGYYDGDFEVLGWENEAYCPQKTCPL